MFVLLLQELQISLQNTTFSEGDSDSEVDEGIGSGSEGEDTNEGLNEENDGEGGEKPEEKGGKRGDRGSSIAGNSKGYKSTPTAGGKSIRAASGNSNKAGHEIKSNDPEHLSIFQRLIKSFSSSAQKR